MKIITYNGKRQCISQWAKELGISHCTLSRYLSKDYSIEDISKLDLKPHRVYLTYNGKRQTLKEWCIELNLDYNRAKERVRRRKLLGWSDERVLTTPVRPRILRNSKMEGKFNHWTVLEFSHRDANHYDFYKCLCECGTTKVVYGQNLRAGLSKSCGCCGGRGYRGGGRPAKQLTYNGITQSIHKWAEELNITSKALYIRLSRSTDDAYIFHKGKMLGLHSSRTGKKYEFNGILYSISELTRQFNIPKTTLRERIARGWSLERAIAETRYRKIK